jgi:hypothetical protein
VPEPDGVLHAIAQAIEAVETRELPLAAAVVARLGRGRRLLVLDNFERVLAAVRR